MIRSVLILFTLLSFICAKAQNPNSNYFIRGVVYSGLKVHAFDLVLKNDNGKIVSTVRSSDSGDFQFKDLASGNYRLINKKALLDTSITIGNESINALIIELNICDVNKSAALQDIKSNTIKLLLMGGVVPTYVAGQEIFEKKFKIKYFDFSCQSPPIKCVVEYNKAVFKYLDKKYKTAWRKEVRTDVIGL